MGLVAKAQKTITRLEDGYTIRLAPGAIVIPANADGSNPVFTSAKTRVFLEKGGANVAITINSVAGTGCTATFSGIEVSITAVSAANGSVAINFTGADGYAGSAQVNFVISKQGEGGADGITVLLDNETHALPAAFDGTVTAAALDTARTKIMVFRGATQLTAVAANATPGAGQFRYNVSAVTGGTAVRIDNSNVKLATITADQAVISLNIYAENLTNTYTKQMTITKVREGKEGPKGSKGALPLFRGEYNKDEYGNPEVRTYYGTENRSDIVMYNGQYYFAKETAGVFNNIAPTDPGQTKWEAFGSQVSSIATGLLLAQKAYIENLVVRNIRTAGEFDNPSNTGGRRFELTSKDNANIPNVFRFAIDAADVNPSWNTGRPDNSLDLMRGSDNMDEYNDNGTIRQLAGLIFNKYFSGVYGNPDYVRITGNGVFSSSSAVKHPGKNAWGAILGFLRRIEGTGASDINAGIVGVQNVSGSNAYAGYFDGKVRADGDVQINGDLLAGNDKGIDMTFNVAGYLGNQQRILQITVRKGLIVSAVWL
ncbi:hypothetical protein [Sphingobacterium thalpophilum]|uniref:hypothetical protein n=1 Tax=Sphingobacterium thalpophilum TaxID=259 RepID=UPI003D9681B0